MEYKYAKNDNFEDFASGRVIYHMGGEPTFPVRLTLEIYGRCLQYSNKKTGITLYDCCCGGGYMLTILGLLKSNSISSLYGSDINSESLKLAEDNLGLLTRSGISRRRDQLLSLYQKYNKVSHWEALHSTDCIIARSVATTGLVSEHTGKMVSTFKEFSARFGPNMP